LLKTAKSTKEEAHAHHKEKIYQDCQLDLGEVDQENVFNESPPISSNMGGYHSAGIIVSPPLVGQNKDHSLPSIEPIREVFTIKISSCTKAMMETMSSTAFLTRSQRLSNLITQTPYPKLAFSRPPSVSPTLMAISSVA